MKECLVSIVIPVYNTESCLRECIESILCQTYKKIEIILIDDGSTDSSSNICDEYSLRDPRVRVFHKSNGGISSARNLGLEKLKGQYVIFVDSDDILCTDYVEVMLANIEDYDALACGYFSFKNQNTLLNKFQPDNKEYIGHEEILNAYLNLGLKTFFYNPWGKIYKATKITMFFDLKMIVAEDIVFNLNFLQNSSKIRTINYCGYGLRVRTDSTTHKIARNYTMLYEHDYRVIIEGIAVAKREFGVSEDILKKEQIKDIPMRYYYEVTNLFRKGSPYTKKEIRNKIRYIHNDKIFISYLKSNCYNELSRAEKITMLSVKVNNSYFTYLLFKLVLKLKNEI